MMTQLSKPDERDGWIVLIGLCATVQTSTYMPCISVMEDTQEAYRVSRSKLKRVPSRLARSRFEHRVSQ